MAGRVEADAKNFDLPYDVLVGRNSDVIEDYQIEKLPRIIIVNKGGMITFTEKFASYEKLRQEVERIKK
jgi:hypothetical protein